MTNETYDKLKWVALILLPAVATFFAAIGRIWNIPYADEIVATIVALDTFLGALVAHQSNVYTQLMNDYEEVYYEEEGEEIDG